MKQNISERCETRRLKSKRTITSQLIVKTMIILWKKENFKHREWSFKLRTSLHIYVPTHTQSIIEQRHILKKLVAIISVNVSVKAKNWANVPYYLKRVRDPVCPVSLLKIVLTARCETIKSHVLKRTYRTISLLRRELSLFRCKTPNQPLFGVPYYETMYVTVKIVEEIERQKGRKIDS